MKNITTQKDLKTFLQTPEAFESEFNYKGFGIWWSDYKAKGIQTSDSGYFRCDPGNDKEYREFRKLEDKEFAGFEWVLS